MKLDRHGILINLVAMDGHLSDLTKALASWRVSTGAEYSADATDSTARAATLLASRLMGIVAECGEAHNAMRKGTRAELETEMADIFIRWAGTVGLMEIPDIEAVIKAKMRKNLEG